MSVFRFKQFVIRQEITPMKVGTDGVLVGAWASVRPSDRRILDIGTGTGLIALMLAQRAPEAQVTGIDIESIAEAQANAEASPWGGRIRFRQTRVQDFRPGEGFDLIVSNPPFFVGSLLCPDAGRTVARHAVSLPFGELRDAVVRLLRPGGRFAVVLPADEAERFIDLCDSTLQLVRRTDVRTTPRRPVKRVLMEFRTASEAASEPLRPVVDSLVIGTGEHETYTPEYRALTCDFYLKF